MRHLKILGLFFLSEIAFCQTSEFDGIKATMNDFLKSNPLWVPSFLTNQNEYSPGDTVFYSAFFLNADNSVPRGKIILTLKLLNSKEEIVEEAFLSVIDGETFGQVLLPDSIDAGIYQLLVTQTNNKKELVLCKRSLQVVKEFEIVEDNLVSFFPEGGRLVQNVSNNVLVYSRVGGNSIQIVNGKGLTEAVVRLDSMGYGMLNLIPKPGSSYFAIAMKERVKLPVSEEDGVAIKLVESEKSIDHFVCHIPEYSKYHNEDLLICLITEGKVVYSSLLNFRDQDSITFKMPDKLLSPLCSELLIVSNKKEVLSSRRFIGVIGETPQIIIKTNKQNLYQRDSVHLNIHVKTLGQNVPTKFSLSLINQPVFNDHTTKQQFDNRSLIKEESYYPWWRILKSPYDYKSWKNKSRITLRGQAVFKETGKPVPDSTIVFFYLQKNFMGYEAITRNNGNFDLVFLFDFFNKDMLFTITEYKGKYLRDVKIIWDDTNEPESRPDVNFKELKSASSYIRYKSSTRLIEESYTFFSKKTDESILIENPNKDFEDEFMGADVSINVADFVVFPTMVDLVREVVPNLQYHIAKGEETVRVIFSKNTIKPADDPLYIVDGRMTKSTKLFLSLKPADILSIKVVKDIYKLGTIGFLGKNGIVYVQSKKDKVVARDQFELNYPVTGIINRMPYIQRRDFGDYFPNFSSTIYWSPLNTNRDNTEGNLSFRLTDDVGLMKLVISGLTDSGMPFYSEFPFEVHFKGRKD